MKNVLLNYVEHYQPFHDAKYITFHLKIPTLDLCKDFSRCYSGKKNSIDTNSEIEVASGVRAQTSSKKKSITCTLASSIIQKADMKLFSVASGDFSPRLCILLCSSRYAHSEIQSRISCPMVVLSCMDMENQRIKAQDRTYPGHH